MRTLDTMLKMADSMIDTDDINGLKKLCESYDSYIIKIFKQSNYVPNEKSPTPNVWKKNLDYAGYENSPWRGSMAEFMKEYPGGLRDWIAERAKEKDKRFNLYSIKDFEKKSGLETIVLLKNNLSKTAQKYDPEKWNGIRTFLSQYSDDVEQAASDAVEDIIRYYSLLRKSKRKKK